MSADNGIYILITPKDLTQEYRVAHLQAIENVDWCHKNGEITENDDIRIHNARRMWDSAQVFDCTMNAFQHSLDLDKQHNTEYGINVVEVDREF